MTLPTLAAPAVSPNRSLAFLDTDETTHMSQLQPLLPPSPAPGELAPKPDRTFRCCCCGCALALMLGFVLITGGTYYGISLLTQNYLSDQPVELAKLETTPEEYAELVARIGAFDEGQTQELILTSDDLNRRIQGDPTLEPIQDHVVLGIKDGLITTEVSVPIDAEVPIFGGKHVNWKMGWELELRNRRLSPTLRSWEITDRPGQITDQELEVLHEMRKEFKNEPELMRELQRKTGIDWAAVEGFLARIDDFKVEEDHVILIKK